MALDGGALAFEPLELRDLFCGPDRVRQLESTFWLRQFYSHKTKCFFAPSVQLISSGGLLGGLD